MYTIYTHSYLHSRYTLNSSGEEENEKKYRIRLHVIPTQSISEREIAHTIVVHSTSTSSSNNRKPKVDYTIT